MDQKITINNRGFYVIPECKKGNYTLCVASESWGASTWGEGTNGQQILDIADNRNPESLTYYWYNSLPDEVKKEMLTLSHVSTNNFNKAGEGMLERTEMFVPSHKEWLTVPTDIRRIIVAGEQAWCRSYYNVSSYNSDWHFAWCVGYDGRVYNGYNGRDQRRLLFVVPAFYISDDFLRSLDEEVKADTVETTPIIFTIWPNHRITTSNIQFRYLNTACCTDIRTLYESMQEISREVKEKCGRDVLFEVTEY